MSTTATSGARAASRRSASSSVAAGPATLTPSSSRSPLRACATCQESSTTSTRRSRKLEAPCTSVTLEDTHRSRFQAEPTPTYSIGSSTGNLPSMPKALQGLRNFNQSPGVGAPFVRLPEHLPTDLVGTAARHRALIRRARSQPLAETHQVGIVLQRAARAGRVEHKRELNVRGRERIGDDEVVVAQCGAQVV